MERALDASLKAHGVTGYVREYLAVPGRKFRVDFAWVAAQLAVEIEGGIYQGGGHTTVTGIKRDVEKGNLLTLAGWRLLRFHGDQVRSGEAVAVIRQALEMAS